MAAWILYLITALGDPSAPNTIEVAARFFATREECTVAAVAARATGAVAVCERAKDA